MLKKVAVALALSCLMAGMAHASMLPKTGVTGSMHDMNAAAGYSGDEIQRVCVFCHTPHNSQSISLAPLWNHAPSTVTLPAYAWVSPANGSIAFNVGDPLIGPSRLCMACHDGATAVDTHGTGGLATHAAGGGTLMTSSYSDSLGANNKRYITDLTVTHPIGFQYDDAVTARNIGTTAELITKDHGFIDYVINPATFNTNTRTGTETAKKIQDTLYGGFVTCASCHDVHNTVNAAPLAANTGKYNYFLYAREEASAICLSCHVK